MPDLYQNKNGVTSPGFDPIALQGHFVVIHFNQELNYRQVMFSEPIPRFQAFDLGPVLAGATIAKTNLTNMDMFDDEFGQFRMWVLDNVQMRIFLPAGVLLHQLKNIQIPLSAMNPLNNPSLNLSEICVWEDDRQAVEAVNGSGNNLSAVRIMVEGYRFFTKAVPGDVAKKIESGDQTATHVWCSGRG